jgi:hypothetical protein
VSLPTADLFQPAQTAALVPILIEGEPRIRDIELGERLGFARPTKIRELIERHAGNLNKISILPTVAQIRDGAGRPSKAYYLNRKQAIFITAKSETEQATDITIEIIERFDAYERGLLGGPASRPVDLAPTPRRIASTFRSYFSIAKLSGMDRNQAWLSAARATREIAGVDVHQQLGITHLPAPQQDHLLTPTQLGFRMNGESGAAVNRLLAEKGLQVAHRDHKNRTYWEPTTRGAPYAVFLDTAKRHHDGTPVRQIKWLLGVLEILCATSQRTKH